MNAADSPGDRSARRSASAPDFAPVDAVLLNAVPTGNNGHAEVTATLAGRTIHADRLDLTRAKPRADYAKAIAAVAPAAADAIEPELLRLRDDLARQRERDRLAADRPSADLFDAPELDPARVVRPELFITPGACGMTVPRVVETSDGPAGRLTTYLTLADGTRERREVSAKGPTAGRLDLPAGPGVTGPLYVLPVPAEPTAADVKDAGGWSEAGRAAWAKGADAPCPADLFARVRERFGWFLALPADDADGLSATLALWALLTYVAPAFPALPYLYVGGPAGSGKSRVFDVLSRLAFRPLATSNVTGPALFRTLHGRGGTVLLDEAERLRDTRSPDVAELLSMLLAGYKAGGRASRLEPVGDAFRPVAFDVFGPKALACIAGLPPALASRCIPIRMTRADRTAPQPGRRIDADRETWRTLRDDLHAFALAHGRDVLAAAADPPTAGLTNREAELWGPLLTLAALCERHGAADLCGPLADFARRWAAAAREESTPDADAVLLEALHSLLVGSFDPPRASDVLRVAKEAEPDLFDRWTARGVSARLKPYGFATERSGGRSAYRTATPAMVAGVARLYGLTLDGVNAGDDPNDVPAVEDAGDPAAVPPVDPFAASF